MFEAPEQQVPRSKAGLWVGGALIIAVVIGGVVYMNLGGGRKASTPTAAATAATAAPAAAAGPADPVRDLRIVSASMDKDYTGTTAQWLVEIHNESPTYTYSDIAYETTYAGADNSILLTNHGTIKLSLGPGEDQSTQIRDALYPAGTSWYRIRITGASSSK